MKKIKIGLIIILMVVEIGSIFLMYKSSFKKNLHAQQINDNITYAVLLETGYNTKIYKNSVDNIWPKDGYTYDKSRSGCIDESGNEVKNILNFDDVTHLATLSVTKSVKCYMYFNKNN